MTSRHNRNRQESEGQVDSKLLKFASKFVLGILIIMVFLTFVQCSIKKPQAPQWTTQFSIPVINRTYQMDELIRRIDQDGITIDSSNNIVMSITQDIDTFRLDAANMSIPNLSYAAAQQLGPFDFTPPTVSPTVIDLSAIGSLAALIPGDVPPMSFQVTSDMPPLGAFTGATITAGEFYIVITNNLGLDFDTLNLEIRDKLIPQIIGTPSFPGGLASGATDSALVSLAGHTISNSFEIIIRAHEVGGTVLSASGKNITANINFVGNITATSATAIIPTTNRYFTAPATLSGTDAIYGATLATGSLQLIVSNSSPLAATLSMSFSDLLLSSVPLLVQVPVAANSYDTVMVNLAGYRLTPSDSTVPQQINVDVSVNIPGTSPNQITLNATNQFSVTANMSGLSFGDITGIFSSTEITIPPTVSNLDIPEGFDSASLVSAILTIEIDNGVNLAGSLNLLLSASNGNSLVISGNIAAGLLSSSVTSSIQDSSVAQFLSPMPTSVTISGSATLGDGITEATISPSDFIFAKVRIDAPLELILGQTTIQTDIERQSIDTADMDIVTDNVNEVRFSYNVINHLPIGAQINLYFGPDSATLFTNPQLVINNLFFNAAPMSGGIVIDTASTGYQTITLDSTDIQILKNDILFISTELILNDSGGQPIKFTGSDYVTIIGQIEIDYLFDGNF